MRITVFGASGNIGRLVTAEALARGHDVVAFVHSRTPFEPNDRLKVIQGDVHAFYDVANAVKGSEAVVSVLGSWGTKDKDILSMGVRNIVECMGAEHITRIVSLTGADAHAKGDRAGILNHFSHFLLQYSPMKKMLRDAERHIVILEASNLDWMIVRSPVMKDRGVARYMLSESRPAPWVTINRKAVASCMVDQVETATYVRKSPFIVQL